MATVERPRASVDDLSRLQDKAELIDGRIVPLMPTGRRPNRIAGNIYVSLRRHEPRLGAGEAYTDNVGFVVPELPSGRESFSPDASYFLGPFPDRPMRFLQGPPTFAVEVRREGHSGPAAEREMAARRADYLEAGTLVVWDVDPDSRVIRCHRPGSAEVFGPGAIADAEPAVPGWRVAVDEVFA